VDWGNEFDGVLRCGLGYRTTQQRWLTGTAYRIDPTSDDETHDRILTELKYLRLHLVKLNQLDELSMPVVGLDVS
jgi:hypothetical protein